MLAAVDAYAPIDAREFAMRDRLRDFVAAHADCFERSLAIGHLTGSAWIVTRALDATVLVHHRKLEKWLQPGGHADGDADIMRVALREGVEETGLTRLVSASIAIFDIDVHAIPARPGETAHEHFDLRYAFFADRDDVPTVSEESLAVAWVDFDSLETYAIDDSIRRLVRKTELLRV